MSLHTIHFTILAYVAYFLSMERIYLHADAVYWRGFVYVCVCVRSLRAHDARA